MKTAEEILFESKGITLYDMNMLRDLKDTIFIAMKLYANTKLDEAAEKATVKIKKPHYDVRDPFEYEVDEESILSLKDQI